MSSQLVSSKGTGVGLTSQTRLSQVMSFHVPIQRHSVRPKVVTSIHDTLIRCYKDMMVLWIYDVIDVLPGTFQQFHTSPKTRLSFFTPNLQSSLQKTPWPWGVHGLVHEVLCHRQTGKTRGAGPSGPLEDWFNEEVATRNLTVEWRCWKGVCVWLFGELDFLWCGLLGLLTCCRGRSVHRYVCSCALYWIWLISLNLSLCFYPAYFH